MLTPRRAENLGFHSGRPLAALVIFRCCLQWRTFQADRTVLFDKARHPRPRRPRPAAGAAPGAALGRLLLQGAPGSPGDPRPNHRLQPRPRPVSTWEQVSVP